MADELATDRLLIRLERAPGAVADAIAGAPAGALARRPAPDSWAPTEVVCHLRDVEELFQVRFHTILAVDEPGILAFSAAPEDLVPWRIGGAIGHPLDPDRWAAERQYLRQDAHDALAAWQRRRREVVTLLAALTPGDWRRGGIHPTRGRRRLVEWVTSLADHDDNHLQQLRRALA